MKTRIANTHKVTELKTVEKFTQIKLGVDVNADSYRVVRQIDGATPQPAQKMTPEKFLEFAQRQLKLGGRSALLLRSRTVRLCVASQAGAVGDKMVPQRFRWNRI